MEENLILTAFKKEIKFLEIKEESIEKEVYDQYLDIIDKLSHLQYNKVSCELHKDVQIIFKFRIDKYILIIKVYGDLTKFYYSLFKFTDKEKYELITYDGDCDRSKIDYFIGPINEFFIESRNENR
jgi:hypothetical protein